MIRGGVGLELFLNCNYLAIRNSQFAVRSSQFAIRNSQFAVRNSQEPVQNLNLVRRERSCWSII